MAKFSQRVQLARELITSPLTPTYVEDEMDFEKADAVVATPFNSYRWGDPPDYSNEDIAEMSAIYMREYGLPFIGQYEQANLLRRMNFPKWQIIQMPTKDGERVMSQRLARFQANEIHKKGKSSDVIRIGIPEHLGRCVLLDAYFGLTSHVPAECADIRYDERLNRSGVQDWCISRKKFSNYERVNGRLGSAAFAVAGIYGF